MTVRVAIVDDSPTMQRLIAISLRRDPEIEVVGFAADPHEARALIKEVNPDVITLDVEMPNMDGLEFLRRLMRLRPMPVVMVSTLTHAGTETALEALSIGAVDVVGKPVGGVDQAAFADLSEKVKAAARARVRFTSTQSPGALTTPQRVFDPRKIIAIGASTGGVETLLHILSRFPKNCPPTVIVQHMPAGFTASFAARLDRATSAQVEEAAEGAELGPGKVFLAPGGATHLEVTPGGGGRCRLSAGEPISGHRPSVDVLFRSLVPYGDRAVGVILTGMGQDGAAGLMAMRNAGAATFGQDEPSSVVYGMPRVAFEMGAVGRQLSLARLPDAILEACSPPSTRPRSS